MATPPCFPRLVFLSRSAALLFAALLSLGCERAPMPPAAPPQAAHPAAPQPSPTKPGTSQESVYLVSEAEIKEWLRRGNEGFSPVAPYEGGRTWVVSPQGGSGTEGTHEAPLGSITEAVERAQPGDRIFISAGTYSEVIHFPRSGEAGKPIILEGERGPNGEWLTVLDFGKPLTGWEPAPEVGPGVFKRPTNGQPLHCLTNHGKQLLRVNDRLMELPWERENALRNEPGIQYGMSFYRGNHGEPKISGYRFLVMPPEGKIDLKLGNVPFWDGIEALYGIHHDTVYLRFRDGRNPEGEDLRGAPDGNAITIEDQSHIVVRHLSIRGAAYAIMLSGKGAKHNVIEENFLQHGYDRITLARQTSHNLIRNNKITLSFYGSDHFGLSQDEGEEGAASGTDKGLPSNQNQIRTAIYRAFKHIQGTDASADIGIRIQSAGTGNRIIGNHVYNGLKGIHCMGTPDLEVAGNVVHNMSSLTLVTLPGLKNARIHDNLLFDSNILLRIHRYDAEPGRSEYHYRNVFRLPENEGKHIYVHYNGDVASLEAAQEPVVGIYHNTFVGGVRGLVCGSFRRSIAMGRTTVLNNIISTRHEPVSYLQARSSSPDFHGHLYRVFDYNWVGGTRPAEGLPVWFGAHNINAPGQQLWPANTQGPLTPPPAIQGKGIDLSRPFTIGKTTYDPLPGMEPGYYSGPAPDPGAFQHQP